MSGSKGSKRDAARALILRDGGFLVYLNPRAAQVVIPHYLRHKDQVVLHFGLNLAVTIPDLRVDDVGIYGTLSFNTCPYTCFVPWDSVFALVSQKEETRGMVWPESMPQALVSDGELGEGIENVVDLFGYMVKKRRQGLSPVPSPKKEGDPAKVINLTEYRAKRFK